MALICQDGRVWGQNNKEAGDHLGVLTGKKKQEYKYIKRGWNPNSKGRPFSNGHSFFGEQNPNWKGGITKIRKPKMQTKEYKSWREKIFKRDNRICQICGRGGHIEAHHILPWVSYPEKRYDLNNGITLCIKHHNKTKGR